MSKYKYIVFDKNTLGGKPIIKGTRISVDLILELLASGGTIETIVESFRIWKEKLSGKPFYTRPII